MSDTPDPQEIVAKRQKQIVIQKLEAGKQITPYEASLFDVKKYAKNQTELAELIGVSRKSIQRWSKDNPDFPKPRADGRWDIQAVRDWRDATRGSPTDGMEELSKSEGEAKRVWLQVEKLEHELKVYKEGFLSSEDVALEVRQMVGRARSILLGMGDKLAPLLSGMSTPQIAKKITEEVDKALMLLASDD